MKRLLTSCFGLGWMPVASGTWGSLPPAITVAVLGWSGCSLGTQHWVQWLWLIYGCVACVALAPAAIAATGKKDPGEIVVDEVAGQAMTFLVWLWLPVGTWTPMQWIVIAMAGFLLFRVFDIFKPTPAHQLESLPKGWGILADDLMAGVYAGLVLVGGCWVVHHLQMGGLPGLSQDLDIKAAILLGAIQGVTEFLPVSSSGHLVLLETLMGFDAADSRLVLFDLATHLGTVLAVLIVMHRSCLHFLGGLKTGLSQLNEPVKLYQTNASVRFAVLAVVGTCVTAVPAILLKDYLTAARGSVWVLGAMWIVTGTLLYLTDRRGKTHRPLRQFGLMAAAMVGLAQLVAIMPGVSRSGSTICAAVLICGLRRRWAIEYSMLLGVIAIVAATALEVEANWSLIRAGGMEIQPLIVGAVTALLVGIPALKWLIYASRRACFRPFALYCYVLAICALFLHFMCHH